MLRTVHCFALFAWSLIIRIPHMLRMGRCISSGAENAYAEEVHHYSSGWAKGLLKATGARMHITGLENIPQSGAFLIVSNHQSDFDIVAYLATVRQPIGFVAKIEMLKVPLLRTWMKYMRSVFIDRKDIRQTAKVILEGISILKSGHSLVLFPEGTRSKSSGSLPFKTGSFKLATKSKAVVVPATISGSYHILEENNYKITPADVYLTFHPPVYTGTLDAEELAALPQKVEETIKAAL